MCPLTADHDAPVGDAPIEILPDLLAEFWLRAVKGIDGGVGFDGDHYSGVRCV